jgi:hypothetical protein
MVWTRCGSCVLNVSDMPPYTLLLKYKVSREQPERMAYKRRQNGLGLHVCVTPHR